MDEELIPILNVADAAVAVAWYRRLGFDFGTDLEAEVVHPGREPRGVVG
jgi:hypothetical protein